MNLSETADELVDAILVAGFRFRTRRFLKMEPAVGKLPPVPARKEGCLYLHVPFCKSLCPFCSFHRFRHDHAAAKSYFGSLRDELRLYHEAGFRFSSAYFGGGTPTIEPAELVKTVELVGNLFGPQDISVETNPADLQPELLRALRSVGVTRLSVGVQSFNDDLLRAMHRLDAYGTGANAAEQIRRAATTFPTVNVDLIFNHQNQTAAMLQRDIEIFRQTAANQVSFYPLMTSSATNSTTTIANCKKRHQLRQFYRLIVARLRSEFYPSSAWCFTRRGHAVDEYIIDADNYVGLGSGAFSYVNGVFYATTFSLRTYRALIAEGLSGIAVRSDLSRSDQMRYSLLVKMFGLGLNREWASQQFGGAFFKTVWPELKTLELLRAARRNKEGWELTERGMYWLVLMMSEFFESVARYREAMRTHAASEISAPAAESLDEPSACANELTPSC